MTRQSFEFEIKDTIITGEVTLDVTPPDPDVGYRGEIEITDCEVDVIEFPTQTIHMCDETQERQDTVNAWVFDWLLANKYVQICEEYGE